MLPTSHPGNTSSISMTIFRHLLADPPSGLEVPDLVAKFLPRYIQLFLLMTSEKDWWAMRPLIFDIEVANLLMCVAGISSLSSRPRQGLSQEIGRPQLRQEPGPEFYCTKGERVIQKCSFRGKKCLTNQHSSSRKDKYSAQLEAATTMIVE